jgi:hypothetical protein
MRGVPWVRFVAFLLAFAPALAYAQASITGIVKDSSGAVLPGVVVEAASPALIEKFAAPSLTALANTASSIFDREPTPSRSR